MTLPELPGEHGRIEVGGRSGGYPVVVGAGLLDAVEEVVQALLPDRSLAIVSDGNVMPLHGGRVAERLRASGLHVTVHDFPAGEASKTRRTWSVLTDALLAEGHGRDAAVIAIGGGVTTDLAGFVAATYMRGIPVVQVPTSYLAMVDASTGGKTGVDVQAGKNLVGAFHRPVAVVADVRTLETLPDAERAEGLVEAVKHGAILDAKHFGALERDLSALLDADPALAAETVLASVTLKAGVVDRDEFEGGYRQILNFGHTLGHAVEAASGYGIGHGSAVAVGMRAEARLGEALGITVGGTAGRLDELLRRLVPLPRSSPSVDEALAYLSADKKVRAGRPRYVLLAEIGRVDEGAGWTHEVPDGAARDALAAVLEGEASTAAPRS